MVKNILIKSPDEWATTKQACRDESVVYLFLSSTNIYIYIYIYIYICLWRKGINKLRFHPDKPVSWLPTDEWATTKQACRDESVAYLFLSSTNIYFALH